MERPTVLSMHDKKCIECGETIYWVPGYGRVRSWYEHPKGTIYRGNCPKDEESKEDKEK
jgi:hypothetical protein